MKLHHTVTRAYLNRAMKDFSTRDLDMARSEFNKIASSRFKLSVKSVVDLTVGKTPIRVYRNHLIGNTGPIIIYFHGGGFVLGSIESHDSVCRYLAKYTDCVVVSVGYSLAPEAKYPKQIEEGISIVEYVHSGKLHGVNLSKIILAGDSAGGTISLAVAIEPKIKVLLDGLVLIYPALDPSLGSKSMEKYGIKHFVTKKMLQNFWDLYQSESNPYEEPGDVQLAGLPPTCIIAAEKDVLHDEGRHLAARLQSQGVIVHHKSYKDMLHGFIQFPRVVSKKKKVFNDINRFIRSI